MITDHLNEISTAVLTPHLNAPKLFRTFHLSGRNQRNAVVDSKHPDSELWKRGQAEWKAKQKHLLKNNPSNAVLSIVLEN